MKRLKFPIAVIVVSLALVAMVGVAAMLTMPIGALASARWSGGVGFGPHGFGGPGFQLPPELQGLVDLPPAERFAHFIGVQVNLKDKNNQPLTLNVSAGTASAVATSSLTITANDGTTKTYAIDGNTVIHGKAAHSAGQAAGQNLGNGDKVIVVSTNDLAAKAIIDVGNGDFGPGDFGGLPPWAHFGHR